MQPHSRTCMICQHETSHAPAADRVITADLCPHCYQRLQEPSGLPLRDFLDKLDIPVLALDEDAVVYTGNKALLLLVGRGIDEIRGRRGGEVFECAFAKLPGGCGRTVHCSGCAIRRAVTETFLTGKPVRTVAYLNRDLPTQFLQLALRISTEKSWNQVLLRIEHIGPAQSDAAELH